MSSFIRRLQRQVLPAKTRTFNPVTKAFEPNRTHPARSTTKAAASGWA